MDWLVVAIGIGTNSSGNFRNGLVGRPDWNLNDGVDNDDNNNNDNNNNNGSDINDTNKGNDYINVTKNELKRKRSGSIQ